MSESNTERPKRSKLKIAIVQENETELSHRSERIPFTKSTSHNKCLDSDKQPKVLKNKENKDSSKRVASPHSKSRQPLEDANLASKDRVTDDELVDRPITPPPESSENPSPLTPTTNLKMLFSAVSPELRNRDKKNDAMDEEQVETEESNVDALELDMDLPSSQESDWKPGSRKEKSLGLLCQKFLQKYPAFPAPDYRADICLDEVAKELTVERRRIYDIVNVLESVEIVSRIAKNKYAWHGKTNLVNTLAKLKALGEAEGYAEQMRKLRDYELSRELEEQNGCVSKSKPPVVGLPDIEDSSNFSQAAMRKDKSLGIMSQKFLMLFLVSQPKTVNLDLSAKMLIGDPNIDRTENGKFKTKIRRLYDIANILTSLDLIRKVHVTEIRGRKPAFKYIGPDVDSMNDISVCYNDGYHRPSSRHSLLDCVKNHNVADLVGTYRSKSFNQGMEGQSVNEDSLRKPFSRHSSFEQICQVAENEINKMKASMSLPASPTESNSSWDDYPSSLSQEEPSRLSSKNKAKKVTKSKHIILQQRGGQFHIVDPDGSNPENSATHKLPVTTIINKTSKAVPKQVLSKESTVVIKTKVPSNVLSKQPTMIPLTKEQIDAVLKSLKVPVPVNKNSEKETTCEKNSSQEKSQDTVTVTEVENVPNSSSECVTEINSVPQQGVKRSLMDETNDQESKKFKIDFPSPPSDEDDKRLANDEKSVTGINKRKNLDLEEKPSPQRALHFTPEFCNTPPLAKLAKINQSISNLVNSDSEMDLAVPLSEDSNDSSSQLQTKTVVVNKPDHTESTPVSTSLQRIAVQLPNQGPTILQFPVMPIPGKTSNVHFQPQTSVQVIKSFSQPMQVIPVTATGLQGQPINFMVPMTYSPPLTPNDGQPSPSVFTFPTSQPNVCHASVQLVHPPAPVKMSNSSAILLDNNNIAKVSTPVDKMSVPVPQLITPTERPSATSSTFFGNTPGGFVPTSSGTSLLTKDIVQTARKLDLPDISA